jgi:predicted anti-sigma-YlaC factor YlaD
MHDHASLWIQGEVTCREIAESTSEYLDDRLAVVRRICVAQHLSSCGECRTYVEQIATVRDAATVLLGQPPFPDDRLRALFRFRRQRSFLH